MVHGLETQKVKEKTHLVVVMKYGRIREVLYHTSVIENVDLAIKVGFANNMLNFIQRTIRESNMEYKQGDRVRVGGNSDYIGTATIVASESLYGISKLPVYLIIRDDGRGWKNQALADKYADFLQKKDVLFWHISPSWIEEGVSPDKDTLKGEKFVTTKGEKFVTAKKETPIKKPTFVQKAIAWLISIIWLGALAALGLWILAWALKHLFLALGIIG